MNAESNAPSPAPAGEPTPAAHVVTPDAAPAPAAGAGRRPVARALVLVLGAIAVVALLLSGLLWQKLALIQEQLARQSADAGFNALEARSMARQAQDLARETAARQAVMDARLSEVALQRSQLEELMQSLSRSRDENLVVDIDSAIRLAQQQAQLTGSVEPLLAALKSAEQRLARAAQPRLAVLQRAIARDLGRIRGTTVSDTPTLLVRLDEVVRMADELPLANAVAPLVATGSLKPRSDEGVVSWWQRSLKILTQEMRGLVRVSRIEQPEAALLSPEQSFFLRENLKLRLLNARLGLLARQLDASRADLSAAAAMIRKYFDPGSRRTQAANAVLLQMQGQMKTLELPRVDDTLAALATAAAGR
jgi:uroporphyrin-III C-methyltransferase